jgi:hypothetical protein
VDFLTCATGARGGRQGCAARRLAAGLPDLISTDPLWRRVGDFFVAWADPASPLYAQVPLAWLEFDHVDTPLPTVPQPGVSFCLDPHYPRRSAQARPLDARQQQALSEIGLALLLGSALPARAAHALSGCFTCLPVGGRIIYLSAMLARRPVSVKVYGSVPKACLMAYLTGIGWTGDRHAVETLLSTFCTTATVDDQIYFDVTIEQTITPILGIAFSQLQIPHLPRKDPRRRALLDHCVAGGLCTPQKRDGLLRWPGSFYATFRRHGWPTRFCRWFDIKIVSRPHRPLEAKGYLGFMPSVAIF